MRATAKQIEELRDRIHNLDLENPKHKLIYDHHRYEFIRDAEDEYAEAYDDETGKTISSLKRGEKIQGNVTVGIGFNMSTKESREFWDDAELESKLFDRVYAGKAKLTKAQIRKLYNVTVYNKEKELKNEYRSYFTKLRANERLLIESLYYGVPGLVRRNTNFYKYITEYLDTGNKEFLQKAIYEVKERSNESKNPGIKNRRNLEALLLDSSKCPFYRKPGIAPLPLAEELSHYPVKLCETIIPINDWPKSDNKNYYIWRTQEDNKVRATHASLEGKIFNEKDDTKIGEPGQEYNCRCYKEAIPLNLKIIKESKQQQNFKYLMINIELVKEKIVRYSIEKRETEILTYYHT